MGNWLLIAGVLATGLAAFAWLMRVLLHKAARAELMAERLPLIAARRQSAALAAHAVWPAVLLSGLDGLHADHPES